jgi:hypothetical protein
VSKRGTISGAWALGVLFTWGCSAGTSGSAGSGTGGGGTGTAAGASGNASSTGSVSAAGGSGIGGSGTGSSGGSGSTASSDSGAGSGSSAGTSGTGGTGGADGGVPAGGDDGGLATGDTPPWRAIMTDTTGFRQTMFSARTADPTVSDPNSHADALQRASVDTSKPLKKKLCIVLTGIGTGPGQGVGDWAGHQGFHVFQVGYSNAISPAANGDTNPDTPGNTRMNQFDAKGRMPSNAQTLRPDSIEERVIKGIQYLKTHDAGGDWGWFLNQDGTMRWSDGCFIGYSYGATHLAVIARYVRIGLGVSASGPQSEGHPNATWLKIPSATPVDRLFAIYGSLDGPATPGHYDDTTLALGYIGMVTHTTVNGMPGVPPYMGSHRIEVDGQGHTEFCAGIPPLYCNYMFGLPPY